MTCSARSFPDRRRGSRPTAILFGILRVALLLLGVLAGVAIFASRSAEAHVGEALRSIGARMMLGLEGAGYSSAPRRLSINGVTLHVVTASVRAELPIVLDQLEAACSERTGVEGTKALLDRLREQLDPPPGAARPGGLHRFESDRDGVVACIDSGGPLSLEALLQRTRDFVRTGDLGAVGELRYAFARRSRTGTSLLLFWTEGNARILEMFPRTGDSPGRDPAGIPRLPGTTRLLSAAEAESPYSLTLYRAADAPGTIANRYRTELAAGGWVTSNLPSTPGSDAILATLSGRLVVLRILPRSSETVISVEELD